MGKFNDIIDYAAKFIETRKGNWDHEGWEGFLKGVQHSGLKLTEETTGYLGAMLESAKKLYGFVPQSETRANNVTDLSDEPAEKPSKRQGRKKNKTMTKQKKQPSKASKPTAEAKEKAEPLTSGRLSKQFLLNLEEGHFILIRSRGNSNPQIIETVSNESKRMDQWNKMVELSLSQKNCYVFENKRQCNAFLKQPIRSK